MSTTNWNTTTDIYDIVDSVNEIKKRYIEDEDETTLALGIYGFITDTESKKIQTATIMTGQLGNEMFPTRANLTKNVLSHAIYNNIEDINAVPANIIINLGIKVEDLDTYMVDNRFVLDYKCPIFIGDYEFHFDYDIIIQRSIVNSDIYSAHYDMSSPNRLSDINHPYLKQPFVITIGNFKYMIIQCTLRQVTIEETVDKIITDSIVENKTYTFEFDNQIADFDVYVTDQGVETRLTPILYGATTEGIEKYCWYLFLSDNTIRISFDSKSYIPGLNSDILIRAYTTLGSEGMFSYKKVDESEEGLFVDLSSDRFNYTKLTCYLIANTNSVNGSNRKSKAELQKLIPKAAFSRGSITTEIDVENYFSLIDNENNRLVMRKKVDNQLSRVWYGYFLLKDELNNIIPTNTVKLKIDTKDTSMYKGEDGRYVLPAGTIISYDNETKLASVIDEVDVPELFTDEYFGDKYYYMTVYNLILNPDPLYAAFYLTISDKDSFFIFNWVNEATIMQFVANRCNFKRNLLTDQSTYKFTFKIAQSILNDYGLYIEEDVTYTDPDTQEEIKSTIVTNNMKCVLVLYKDGIPYRWTEAKMVGYEKSRYLSSWEVDLETDNGLDDANRIKIDNLHVVGKETDINYGYFDANTKAVMYVLAKFEAGSYGRYDLDDIAPGFNEYSVTNIYRVEGGITFYENFTNVLDTRVKVIEDSDHQFSVSGVPVIGLHYMIDETQATYLTDAINERKAYIEYCLALLENNMNIDFKFFNTYGPSLTYTIGDNKTMIGHVDLEFRFRASIKNNADIYTKDDLIQAIKEYIEDLYETGNWSAPNMISELMNKFSDRCNFIEFMNYNDFWLGVQHISVLENIEDPHIVPEFLNIRNKYNIDGVLEPCIDMEILSS